MPTVIICLILFLMTLFRVKNLLKKSLTKTPLAVGTHRAGRIYKRKKCDAH